MILTTTVAESTGSNIANLYFWSDYKTQNLFVDGKIKCELYFYRSEADKDSGKDKVYPIVNGQKVTNSEFSMEPGEIIKVGGNCTIEDVSAYFDTKLKAALEAKYPTWSINI